MTSCKTGNQQTTSAVYCRPCKLVAGLVARSAPVGACSGDGQRDQHEEFEPFNFQCGVHQLFYADLLRASPSAQSYSFYAKDPLQGLERYL